MSTAGLRMHSRVWRIGGFATAPPCDKRAGAGGTKGGHGSTSMWVVKPRATHLANYSSGNAETGRPRPVARSGGQSSPGLGMR